METTQKLLIKHDISYFVVHGYTEVTFFHKRSEVAQKFDQKFHYESTSKGLAHWVHARDPPRRRFSVVKGAKMGRILRGEENKRTKVRLNIALARFSLLLLCSALECVYAVRVTCATLLLFATTAATAAGSP